MCRLFRLFFVLILFASSGNHLFAQTAEGAKFDESRYTFSHEQEVALEKWEEGKIRDSTNCADNSRKKTSSQEKNVDLPVNHTKNGKPQLSSETELVKGSLVQTCRIKIVTIDSGNVVLPELYYEECMLERNGISHFPKMQPVISGIHFFTNSVTAPFKLLRSKLKR